MTRRLAVLAVSLTALAGIAAGCGSDNSGNTDQITVPSIATSSTTTPSVVTEPTTPTVHTDTTPNVYTTPPQTTPSQNQGNGNGGNSQQNYNQYCKQYPGACGD